MTPAKPNPPPASAPASLAPAPGSAAGPWDDDDCANIDEEVCGMCGGDEWIMLSDAGPSEWGEDCFCEIDRPIACPECSRPKTPNDPATRELSG